MIFIFLSLHLTENVLLMLIRIVYPKVSKEEKKCNTYVLVSNQLVARAAGVPGTTAVALVSVVDSSSFAFSFNG